MPLKQDGKFIVSKIRFQEDYLFVDTLADAVSYLQQGYKVRVSDPVTRSLPVLLAMSPLRLLINPQNLFV